MKLPDAIGSDEDGADCTLDKTCMNPDKIPEHLGEERYDLNDMFFMFDFPLDIDLIVSN